MVFILRREETARYLSILVSNSISEICVRKSS